MERSDTFLTAAQDPDRERNTKETHEKKERKKKVSDGEKVRVRGE